MAELKRTLSLGATIFFGVGSILGAGIYTIIGKVAGLSGNMLWLSFSIASVTALLTAFSYAELSSAFPKSGGEYVYTKRAFGKKIGLFLGIIISLNGIVSGATVATGFAGYLSELTNLNTLLGALGIITLLFLINTAGIRESSSVNIVFTLIEVSGLLLIIYIGVSSIGDVNLMEMPPQGIKGIFSASALAFFAYIGFEEIVKLSEETKDPKKTIPRALFTASIIVIIVYIVVALCAVSVLSYNELAQSSGPLASIAESAYGNTGVLIISIIALFATANTLLSNMLGSSRVLMSIGKETKLLSRFSKVSEKSKTPVSALVLILIVMWAFALIGNIETIARIANVFIFITFIVVNLAVITLRVNEKDLERPYKIPFNIKGIPLFPILGIFMTLLLFGFNLYMLVGAGIQ